MAGGRGGVDNTDLPGGNLQLERFRQSAQGSFFLHDNPDAVDFFPGIGLIRVGYGICR